jgi:predicted CopG family antitoxin
MSNGERSEIQGRLQGFLPSASRKVTIRVSEDVYLRLWLTAREREESEGDVVGEILERELPRYEVKVCSECPPSETGVSAT